MSFLQKEIWLPKTHGGRLFLAIIFTFLFVYTITVISHLIENGYAMNGDYVCSSGFDYSVEYTCSVWGAGLAAIATWLEISSFFALLPVIIPCLFVWLLIEALANKGKNKKIIFALGQINNSQAKSSTLGNIFFNLFIAFTIYLVVMFMINTIFNIFLGHL